MRDTTRQLSLFDERLRAEVEELHGQLTMQKQAMKDAQHDIAQLRKQLGHITHERDGLHHECRAQSALVSILQSEIRRLSRPATSPPSSSSTWVDEALRQLLTVAHPDKWSQGQPAADLAHELAVTINNLRQKLER